jgi:hypothetical protein
MEKMLVFTTHYFYDLLLGKTIREYMFCSMKYVEFMVRLEITYSNQKSSRHVATSSIMPGIGTLVHDKQHHISL